MTTVRERLEHGYPEYAVNALSERGGKTPLCCFRTVGSRMTCSWLGRLVTKQEFDMECLKCQEEMVEKLGTQGFSPSTARCAGHISSPFSLEDLQIERR